MTADLFLEHCALCYDANGYFRDSDPLMTPRQKYKAFADRDMEDCWISIRRVHLVSQTGMTAGLGRGRIHGKSAGR
jgi:hypothetical protein